MDADGVEAEVEGLGMIAMIGLLVVPGAIWIAKGATSGSKARRGAMVVTLLLGVILLETKMDGSAQALVHAMEGKGA